MGKVYEVEGKIQEIQRKTQIINEHEKIHSLVVI